MPKRKLDLLDKAWKLTAKSGGRTYRLDRTFLTKTQAVARAKYWRSRGYAAMAKRVVNVFDRTFISQKYLWRVYIRPLPKKRR